MEVKEKLIREAVDALKNSYAPYSRYRVGAAVLAGGNIYKGSNVENASYGLTVCAERAAAVAAVTDGEREFQAVAIAVADGFPSPCGACRQFLREFGEDFPVYLVAVDGTWTETNIGELLPNSFGPSFLNKERRPVR